MKRNNVSIGLPALAIACVTIAFAQVTFALGCAFFSISKSLLQKWKTEAKLYKQSDISKIRMWRIVKSLELISIPAGNVGVIDKDITMNYMNYLLQNIINVLLTMKDI